MYCCIASHDQGLGSSSCLIVYVTIPRKYFISSNQIFCCPNPYNEVTLPHSAPDFTHSSINNELSAAIKNVKWSVILDNAWRANNINTMPRWLERRKSEIIEHNWFIDRVIICKQVQTIISNVIFLLHLLILLQSVFFCPSFRTNILKSCVKST